MGRCKGVLSTTDLDDASLVAKAKASPGLVGRDLVREVIPERSRAIGTDGLSHVVETCRPSRSAAASIRRADSTSWPSTTA